jgi:allophanate hydrolase subunit 1
MRTRRVGARALLVLVEDPRAAVAVRGLVLKLAAAGDSPGLPAPVDVVPAARTVLLDGLPGPAAVDLWRARLADAVPHDAVPLDAETPDASRAGRERTLEVTYDGEDLDVVAKVWGCSREALIERHQGAEFLVAFCGFAPGFAYCIPTQPLPEVPRRDDPRERVPRGSVALAGEYCGVYPEQMPGGWQLIGRTSAVLFDPGRDEPALLVPGDTVRFRAVS